MSRSWTAESILPSLVGVAATWSVRSCGHGERRRQPVVGDVRPDPPVRPLLLAGPEAVDRRPLPQRPHLVVDHAEHAERVQRPEPLRLLLLLHVAAAVRDEDRLVPLPDRLEAEVVVDAAVREERPCRERRTLAARPSPACTPPRRASGRPARERAGRPRTPPRPSPDRPAESSPRQRGSRACTASRSARGLPTGGSSR